MVEAGAFSHKIDWVKKCLEILKLKWHQNCIIGFKVVAILLNGWVLPIGGVASVKVGACSLCRRLVLIRATVKTKLVLKPAWQGLLREDGPMQCNKSHYVMMKKSFSLIMT